MNNQSKVWASISLVSMILLLAILAREYDISLTSFFSSSDDSEEQYNSTSQPDPISQDCLNHSGLARHDHATLKIFINGEQELIPANIGIMTEICNQQGEEMHAVHTHDSSGRLHIESNEPIDIPIGVFFDIWGQHFDETGIFEYRVNSTHELVMTVGNNTVDSYDDYLLVNTSEVIEIRYQSRE